MKQVRKTSPWSHRWLTLMVILTSFCPLSASDNARTTTSSALPTRLADGFDFPVGNTGNAAGYYMARSMVPYSHMGDDWNGVGGGNSDLGDPIYAIADGLVVYSYDYGSDWGEVIIIRHKYRNSKGEIDYVDSFYGHVQNRQVKLGESVRRGEQIAEIGNNNGMYLAHLHLEIRKNIQIGIETWKHSKSSANYLIPKQFIAQHRPGSGSGRNRDGMVLAQTRSSQPAHPLPGYDRSLRVLMDRHRETQAALKPVVEVAKNDVDRAVKFGQRAVLSVMNKSKSALVEPSVPNRIRTSREPDPQFVAQVRKESPVREEEATAPKRRLLLGLLSKKEREEVPTVEVVTVVASEDKADVPKKSARREARHQRVEERRAKASKRSRLFFNRG